MNGLLKNLLINSDTLKGVSEKVLYAAFLFVAMKLVKWNVIDTDDAAYIACGGVAAVGTVVSWYKNRPSSLMNRAAGQMPPNTKLVIAPMAAATNENRREAVELAAASNDKVVSH